MDPISPDHHRSDAQMLQAMTLVSVLSSAAEVRHAIKERQAGRDPSRQEPAQDVLPFLDEAGDLIGEMFRKLRIMLVFLGRDQSTPSPDLVRQFDALLLLNRLGRALYVVHQRLLSLYPAVPETLIEDARRLHQLVCALPQAEQEVFEIELDALVAWGDHFTDHLAAALAALDSGENEV